MMRSLTALALAAAALAPPGAAAATPAPWATVNVCDPGDRPGAVGVRVGVPAGPGDQWFRVRLQYWDAGAERWRAADQGGQGRWTRLGGGRTAARGGTTFVFRPPSVGKVLLVRGLADVQWRRGRAVKAQATVRTRGGRERQSGTGISRAECLMKR